MRAAPYASSVETLDHLRRYAGRLGWHVGGTFTDRERLLCRAAEYDVVVVERLSDLIVISPMDAWNALHRLLESGVALECVSERNFCTMSAAGPVVLEIARWIQRHRIGAPA